MVAKAGLGTGHGTANGFNGKVILGKLLIIFQSKIRYRILGFRHGPKQKSSRLCSLGANVGMGEGVQNRSVHLDTEKLNHFKGKLFVHILHKGIQQGVQLSHINRIIGYGWNMLIKDLQSVNGFIQILGRLYLQESGALPKEFLIIRDDIAGTHRSISFEKVANALLLRLTT